ncbi:hypothetical protein ASD67_19685 [Sphingopyxis sp. Root1497]|uniref:hypothetical protein n=1 Tax=Sphingopyxis sp. Root1497 TaxID=1736474 RepID=UPI0006FF1B35|nr:hypothetical protein [Sphingopyxis sp. Root1497]KQZ61446.1 hypothetical protein ASD67_19685 [Sphingopyxis sp. Root1497]
MAQGNIIVDICSDSDPQALKTLVASSKAYWTSTQKGFKLISDDGGSDYLRVYKSQLSETDYQQGSTVYHSDGDVILIYEKIVG